MKQFQPVGSLSGRFLYAGFYGVMNEAILACRFLQVQGSYMLVSTVY